MFSALLLTLIWLSLTKVLARQGWVNGLQEHVPAIAFVMACMTQSNISYILVNTLQAPRAICGIFFAVGALSLGILAFRPRQTVESLSAVRSFLVPRGPASNPPSPSEGILRKLRASIVITALTVMTTTQLLTSTVYNWDSNWYNLSRIPAMIIGGSTFPGSAGNPWQILHPFSHDLLYTFDICMGSLRGMGLVSTMEFAVTLGCLYSITNKLLDHFGKNEVGIQGQCSLLAVTLLFLSSDLQLLQTAHAKNDLALLMVFSVVLSISLEKRLRQQSTLLYLLLCFSFSIYSIACKGYGIIAIIPMLTSLFLDGMQCLSTNPLSLDRLAIGARTAVANGLHEFMAHRRLLACTGINSLIMAYSYGKHLYLITTSDRASELLPLIQGMSNTNGSVMARLHIFCLNSIRNIISFITYPYSTLLKPHATRGDDYLLGFGPFNGIISDPTGLANGSQIVRRIHEDSAHGSALLVPFIAVTVLACILSIYMSRPSPRFIAWNRLPIKQSRFGDFYTSLWITLLSPAIAFLFISYSLYGQPYGSRFMGSTYVPLIPLASVICFQVIRFRKVELVGAALMLTILCGIRVSTLLDTKSIVTFASQLSSNRQELAFTQSTDRFYYYYVSSFGDWKRAKIWLSNLENLPADKTNVLCYEDQTVSLAPLMHSIQSYNHSDHLRLATATTKFCKEATGRTTGSNKDNTNYNLIRLP